MVGRPDTGFCFQIGLRRQPCMALHLYGRMPTFLHFRRTSNRPAVTFTINPAVGLPPPRVSYAPPRDRLVTPGMQPPQTDGTLRMTPDLPSSNLWRRPRSRDRKCDKPRPGAASRPTAVLPTSKPQQAPSVHRKPGAGSSHLPCSKSGPGGPAGPHLPAIRHIQTAAPRPLAIAAAIKGPPRPPHLLLPSIYHACPPRVRHL